MRNFRRWGFFLLLLGFFIRRADGSWCDFSSYCSHICGAEPCLEIYWDGFCEPWENIYGWLVYVGYKRMYDCDGHECVCEGTNEVNGIAEFKTKGECLKVYGGRHIIDESTYNFCSGKYPPPPCDEDDQCCLGGGRGGNGGGSPPPPISLISTVAHSLPLKLELQYNHKHRVDRGIGRGWSHTYLYTLEEREGNILITNDSGFSFLYLLQGDGNYASAPYDRTLLTRESNNYIATFKDGTRYLYRNQRLERIEDRNHNFQTLNYSAEGLLTSVNDNFGRSIQFFYTESNGIYHLKGIRDPNNQSYSFFYEGDHLKTIVYPDNTRHSFEYNNAHYLTHILDKKGNTSIYEYDEEGRIIRKGGGDGGPALEIDYNPESELFADDFEAGIGSWTEMNGVIEAGEDPEGTNKVLQIHPGRAGYSLQSGVVESLKCSFDLRVSEMSSKDFLIKIYESVLGEESGVWLKFTAGGKIQAEIRYEGSNRTIEIAQGLSVEEWHKIVIEVDARIDYNYFKLWIDCEYLGGYPFKGETHQLDTVVLEVDSGGNILLDNFLLSEIKKEGKRLTTDALGNKEVLTISENEFGGKSYSYKRIGKKGKGCSCNSTRLYEYDDKWNLRRIMNGKGVVTEMSYDERGNLLTKTEAKGTSLERTASYTYHPLFNKVVNFTIASVDKPGYNKITSYTYDERGNLLTETVTGYSNGREFTYTTGYQYNSKGQITQVDGPRKDVRDVINYTYHPDYGYLTAITYPNGTITYSDYDENHNVGRITDLNSITTTYTYDYANRLKTITKGSAVTTYGYDPAGNIDYVEMPAGNCIDYEYDRSNRLIRITDDQGNYIAYEYDCQGNKIREQIYDNEGTLRKYLSFEYELNLLSRIKNPDNSFTSFIYDENGNRTQMVKPEGEVTEYEYDELNRLKKVIEAKGTLEEAITEYTYDTQDNLIQIKDGEGKITSYHYDDFGRLLKVDSPDTGNTSYTYDEAGNLKTKKDARGITTCYIYDEMNRLLKIDLPSDPDIIYTYDEIDVNFGRGQLTRVDDASDTTRYSYDERGNIIEQKCSINGMTYTTRYEYNLNNEVKKIYYPSGTVVDYGLNPNGKITSITIDGNTVVSGINYEPFGDMNSMNFVQNGITTTITWNNQYQISEIQAGSVLQRTYTHDLNGNISSIQPHDSLPLPQVYTGTENYTYIPGTDLIQNINDGDNTSPYAYDGSGNLISDGRLTYQYNESNQLIKILQGSNMLAEYTYNAKGQRVKKVADGRTTIYHYDLNGNLIQETDGSGNLIASYVYAGMNRIVRIEPDGAIYYYHNDHLGTPLAMTDAEGNIVWKAAYEPFGKAVVDPSSTVTNNFRFPGQYYDEESGLHYNWHRYYDPGRGRYMTADPLLMPFFYNRKPYFLFLSFIPKPNKFLPYVYAKNNPLALIDTKGLVCGSGWTDEYIPDEPFGYDFTKCCQKHDDCYGDCCTPRSDCDQTFLLCMVLECTEPACVRTAQAYYVGVRIFGGWAFIKARFSCP